MDAAFDARGDWRQDPDGDDNDAGNVIRCSDWLIDLGPEGGDRGGELVACGTPEEVAQHPTSHTGRYLAKVLEQHPPETVPLAA